MKTLIISVFDLGSLLIPTTVHCAMTFPRSYGLISRPTITTVNVEMPYWLNLVFNNPRKKRSDRIRTRNLSITSPVSSPLHHDCLPTTLWYKVVD